MVRTVLILAVSGPGVTAFVVIVIALVAAALVTFVVVSEWQRWPRLWR